ncbi:Hypothetical protein R9X50_00439600 [Acrodontium crateriforme]|uniref:NAD(P)-binding domain-containing protein n=1 Tax=Acrodontium crateriforme TaxID=150365 RepID=A0AAQ3M4M8_9PEZI|nr:Hypothetical protein R9X50_00439600 [Acrodontium crateriforme]
MHIFLLGANGRTGQLVTAEALKQGHIVTALIRNASTLNPRPNLNIVQGSPLNKSDIEKAFTNTPVKFDAVIDTLAATRASNSPFSKQTAPKWLMRDAIRNITPLMHEHNITRIIIMSAFGSGSSYAHASLPLKLLVNYSGMTPQFQDHTAIGAEVKAMEWLDWTLVRPPMLTDDAARPVRSFGEDGEGVRVWDSCSRESVAVFLVGLVEKRDLVRKSVVIAN